MSVTSVQLTQEEKAFLKRLVREGKYQSISDALKAGIYELMRAERLESLPWSTCVESSSQSFRLIPSSKGFLLSRCV